MVWLLIVVYLIIGFVVSALAYRFGEIDNEASEVLTWIAFYSFIPLFRIIKTPILWLWWKIAGEQ